MNSWPLLKSVSTKRRLAPDFRLSRMMRCLKGGVYVCRQTRGQKRDGRRGLSLDGGRARRFMVEGNIDDEQVIAITCLQSLQLAYQDASDENALFIAHAREDVPALLAEIRRLR
ncbi:hypothetical protein GCM10008957_48190 [Deinococcus ruber]|uniref:Uncharacterized protein n=2 Tax=Deinococcus ruber TaxID=1848197 RepID=A0A918CPF1_9DEIO|nr:hypothetical protein GCM10008957_48190 [Deinococcus ruber]